MSKFIDTAATAHILSLAAMEEASRLGQRTADLDALLLALTMDSGTAGQVLRGLAVTIGSARDAVDAEHAAQLASVGVHVDLLEARKIQFHETSGYEWSDRALTVIRRAGREGGRGDAPAVLRELAREPSGMIESILGRLDTTPDQVIHMLEEAASYPDHRPDRTVRAGSISGSSEAFAPAPPDQVWTMLMDPSRTPDWDPAVGHVDGAPTIPRMGDIWLARSRTHRPDGKALRVRPDFVTQRVELVAAHEGASVEWRYTFPDAPSSNARRLRVELEPAAGGTQLRLTLEWERPADRRRRPLIGFLMRPLHRLAIWLQLTQLGGGIARVFR